jgi:hypothetical protein
MILSLLLLVVAMQHLLMKEYSMLVLNLLYFVFWFDRERINKNICYDIFKR